MRRVCNSSSLFALLVVTFLTFGNNVLVREANCQNTTDIRLSTNVRPFNYEIHIKVDISRREFSGEETIYVRVYDEPTDFIELHLMDLDIDELHVLHMESEREVGILSSDEYSNETEKLLIKFSESLEPQKSYRIHVAFKGELRSDMKGLYISSYYDNSYFLSYMATTFSAAAYARKIFPCFDEPSFKSTFNLAVTNQNNYVTLANTRQKSVEIAEPDVNRTRWKTTTFEQTPIMSTYLLAFAVAEFQNITEQPADESSPTFSVYSSRDALSSMAFALDFGRRALKALEEFIGHDYQLAKMDFIAIDDFLMGAMENWGLVSFKSSRIMNPDGARNQRKIQEITNIIAHELVHMFFGNQVTCDYWDFVWINEGFAKYLETVIAEKATGNGEQDWFVVSDMHPVMKRDVPGKNHPMTRKVTTNEEIRKIYDFIAYPKAASVIRMIESIMKPEIFRKALNAFIHERSDKTATDEQLYEILERTRREINPEANYPPIPEIFRSWTNNAGYPIVNVEFTKANSSLRVVQELFVPQIGNISTASQFLIVYSYRFFLSTTHEDDSRERTNWLQADESEKIHAEALHASPEFVLFNLEQTGYFRVNYDNENWQNIIKFLTQQRSTSEQVTQIPKINRAQLLDDSFNLAKAGYLDFAIALDLLNYLSQEVELDPLVAGFRTIEFLMEFLDEQNFYQDLRDRLVDIVEKIYVQIRTLAEGELAQAGSVSRCLVMTRLHVNQFACRIGVKSCLSDVRQALFLVNMEYTELDVDERPYLYCGSVGEIELAQNFWSELKKKIVYANNGNEHDYRNNQEEFNEIFDAFSLCDKSSARVERLLVDIFIAVADDEENDDGFARYDNVTNDNALQVVANLIKGSSAGRSLVMKFYMENFDAVNEKAPFGETLSMFAEAINTRAHLELLISLASAAGLDADDESVSATIAQIEENIRWIRLKAPEIEHWLKGGTDGLKFSMLAVLAALIFVQLFK